MLLARLFHIFVSQSWSLFSTVLPVMTGLHVLSQLHVSLIPGKGSAMGSHSYHGCLLTESNEATWQAYTIWAAGFCSPLWNGTVQSSVQSKDNHLI